MTVPQQSHWHALKAVTGQAVCLSSPSSVIGDPHLLTAWIPANNLPE